MLTKVERVVMGVESRAKEMEECATELSEGMIQKVNTAVRELKWSKSEIKIEDPYRIAKLRPTSSLTSLKKTSSIQSI